MQLMTNMGTVAEGIKVLAVNKERAYLEWIRADHLRLSRLAEGQPQSNYIDDRAREFRDKYDALASLYDERLASGLAWMQAEFLKRAEVSE